MIASLRRILPGAAHWVALTLVAVVAGATGAVTVLLVRPAAPAPRSAAGQSPPPAAEQSSPSALPSVLPAASGLDPAAAPREWPDVDDLTSTTNTADGYRLTQPDAAATAVPIGGTVTLHGDHPGERVDLSVVRVIDPFAYPKWPPLDGNRWISLTVHVHNTGTVPFIAYPEKDSLAIDTQGRWYHYSGPMTAARGFQRLQIAPNYDADGAIVFEVPQTAELARIRLTLKAGTPARTADWTL